MNAVVEKADISQELERLGFQKGSQYVVPSSSKFNHLCGWYSTDRFGKVDCICDWQGYLWETIRIVRPQQIKHLQLKNVK